MLQEWHANAENQPTNQPTKTPKQKNKGKPTKNKESHKKNNNNPQSLPSEQLRYKQGGWYMPLWRPKSLAKPREEGYITHAHLHVWLAAPHRSLCCSQ